MRNLLHKDAKRCAPNATVDQRFSKQDLVASYPIKDPFSEVETMNIHARVTLVSRRVLIAFH